MANRILIFLLAVSIALGVVGCGGEKNFGQKISTDKVIKIRDILSNVENFESKTVKVEGEIIRECPVGGWFDLKDDSGYVYVDLHPANFTIPQSVGRVVTAEGKVVIRSGKAEIVGQGVQIK